MLATIGTSSTSLSVWAGNGGGVSAVIGSSFEPSEDSPTCLENASKSAAGAAGASFVTVSAGSGVLGNGLLSRGSFALSQGGTLGASSAFSASCGALPAVIAVEPPAEFSPKYEVILILEASINPRSSTLPKSSRSVEKASVNIPLPIELLYTLPLSA